MVYCGKPSRGCQMCRTRRIKCDETKPTCLQCQKSRRQCPGYKDDFDLVFRNETQATERRARKSIGHAKKASASMFHKGQITFSSSPQHDRKPSGGETLISPSDSESSMEFGMSTALHIPIEQQASCFFLHNFVHTPRDQPSRGWFDFLHPLIKADSPDTVLSSSFAAVAMASLANRPNTKGRGLMPQAIGLYAKALKQINLALQTPSQQKQDSTLASILLLGFFESVTSERSNVMAWGSHIDGAVQLVKLRGKKQLRTKTGLGLFLNVRTQMLIHCMSASRSPILGVDWWVIESPSEPGFFIMKLLLRVTELRGEINHCLSAYPRTPEYFEKVIQLMRRAQDMEQEFLHWVTSIPEPWQVKTVAWVDNVPGGDITKADVCPGKVDMYADIFITVMWNHSRVARLFLAGMIIRCAAWICSPVDYRTTPEYASCARIGVDMVTDIIASVPYCLGWRVNENGQLKPGDLSGFTTGQEDITSTKALGGFFLVWPLFGAVCSDYTSDSQRQWIKGRMNIIGDVMGMNQAKTIGSFQIRLPSMIIRRDNMGATYPLSAQEMAKNALKMSDGTTPVGDAPHFVPPLRSPEIPPSMASLASPMATPSPPSTKVPYVLSPYQQNIAIQREAYEKERKMLLRKASNFGGESAERIISDYLVI